MTHEIISNYKNILIKVEQLAQQYNRNPDQVQILPVSKGQTADVINLLGKFLLENYGKAIFGESYYQEFESKRLAIDSRFRFYFIGRIQSNKIKKLVQSFACLQSVASLDQVQKINIAANQIDKIQDIYLQVNISNDPKKSGFVEQALNEDLAKTIKALNNINLIGLMTITEHYDQASYTETDFFRLAELRNRFATFTNSKLMLSMGMTNDYEFAIKAGSNLLRLGTMIFGEKS